jgi:hypothetical protein
VEQQGLQGVSDGEVTCTFTDIGTGHKPSEWVGVMPA